MFNLGYDCMDKINFFEFRGEYTDEMSGFTNHGTDSQYQTHLEIVENRMACLEPNLSAKEPVFGKDHLTGLRAKK